jgi:hypothetical protein
MKIPIVMPTYNRPDYLLKVLAALSECENLNKFKIITSEEPNEEVSKVWDNVNLFECEVERHKNPERFGCTKNIFSALNLGFEQSDKVIVLEDDIVPSKDFLNFFLWAFEEYKDDKNVFGISTYQLIREKLDENLLDKAVKLNLFNPWGWGLWKDSFDEIKTFTGETFLAQSATSWDILLFNKVITQLKYNFIFPKIGRTQNIGEHGTYVPSAEWQRANVFTPFNASSYDKTFTNFKEIENGD